MDIVIKNAKIIDGSGKAAYNGTIGVSNGKFVLHGDMENAACVIDATGKYVAPGFIDAHSHGDELLGADDFGELCKVNQGVTTQIVGQCGISSAPTSGKIKCDPLISPENMNDELVGLTQLGLSWTEYMQFARKVPKVTNYKFFVGFNTIRAAVMGFDNRKPTASELEQMRSLLREAMEAGAVGMSSGLIYVPGTYADTDELVEVAKAMASYGGIYATHMRNESDDLLSSVQEAIEIGRRASVAVNISHFKVMGRRNWGKHKQAIKVIEQARAEGIDVTCDQYPYDCSMTYYTPCIPPWHFSDGIDALIEKLKSESFRRQLREEICSPETDFENWYINTGGWDGITICTSPCVPEAEGLTIAAYAEKIGKDPFDAYFDLVIENKGLGTAIYHSISDDDVADIIRLPYVMVGSDGIVNRRSEKCHPRGWGTMVRAICFFCKDRNVLSLEELIYRMTGLTAERFSLYGKGYIREGYDADLVVFDYDNLRDNATYANPTALADGIDYVIIKGKIVYRDHKLTDERLGEVL